MEYIQYAALDEQYAKEQNALSKEISDIETALAGFEINRKSADKFISLVEKYENFEDMNTMMLNEFVRKIHVYERDKKGRVETTQQVDIFFNFVGKYVPPHFGEVVLTPEEREEIRKIEERKERLHQNYLRRKEAGKVAKDYEKSKDKKKADMDAKKNALRAEDISKGIFIPVKSLPKAEPKIADMTA